MRSSKLILALVAVGFLTTLVEVRYLHRGVVREHAVAWVPTVASAVAALAALAALADGVSRKIGGAVLALCAVAGLVGVYFHTEFKPSAFLRLFEPSPTVARASEGEEGEDEYRQAVRAEQGEHGGEGEEEAPALAPLGITGLALIGAVAALGRNGRLPESFADRP